MPLIKDGQRVGDPWTTVADGDELPASGPVIVSLARWRGERAALRQREAGIGVSMASDEPPSEIAGDLDALGVVALQFPKFTDGRAYSHARMLRERHGYTGELRAVGHVLADQFMFMHRCGFDAFEVANEEAADAWQTAISEIGLWYQPTGDARTPLQARRREAAVEARARDLAARYDNMDGEALLDAAITREFPGRIALVSSFGTEAAVLLHMVSRIDPATPVIFLDSGKLFAETLDYRAGVIAHLGLSDVRTVMPDPAGLAARDADGLLWRRDPDLCCFMRKVEPLNRALAGFDAWITGRKSYHGGERNGLAVIEAREGRIKLNPLAGWGRPEIEAYFERHDLPRHPLEAEGFLSVGCVPCTDPVAAGEDPRAGRWRGQDKTECGIHFGEDSVQQAAARA